ncbi:Hsp20/alpha crystallin family protein [Ilyomonas limi]|uniref:Hsp20/alpha crystallin family protein n=1 Tax=Ilyomonas limi TaxID=2575867 RepID=A0A4U3L7A8_9BACT|nr:Hsp20/alpha crystallin family protein [Ilyomonas limi]TKK70940.1 Hsp20/alpha crystallin family protein [Ilyomonas limi]
MYSQCNTAGSRPAFHKYGHFTRQRFGNHPWATGFRRPKYNVPVNIVDNAGSYEVHVYATGFAKENIRLSVADGVLYISGTREVDENYLPNFSLQEYPIKSFERVIALNEQVDTANISAKQENGVLLITLPKTPEAQKPAQEVKIE